MSIASRISKLEKELSELKIAASKEVKVTKKPVKIEDCKSIEQLSKFTITELKEWLKKKKINVKKVTDKHKEDFVKIVWENISEEYESESDDSDESDLESDEEWEYYYE